jgi:hypothetical protein
MAYHDDLLTHALQLVHTSPPTQLTLRRAVSSAYYAVFHLLISEATLNWANVSLRAALGRAYDHGVMKTASNRVLSTKDFPFTGEDKTVVDNLRLVAQTFSQLQEQRQFADYNLTKERPVPYPRSDRLRRFSTRGPRYAESRSHRHTWCRSSLSGLNGLPCHAVPL